MSEKVAIRVAQSRDADATECVYRASFPQLMATAYEHDILVRVLPLFTRANPTLLASGTYYVAEIRGEVIGCGGWSRELPGSSSTEPGLGHIRHFAIASQWIRRGIGRALYERCQHDARAAGVEVLECYASRNGEPFYAALGFKRLAVLDLQLGPDVAIPAIRMSRAI